MAAENAGALLDRGGHQGAHRRAADAAMGRVPGKEPRAQITLRVRSDEADERGDGAHHHAASARCARAPFALPEEAPGAGRQDPEEGTGRLPQPDAGNALPAQAEVRRDLTSSQDTAGHRSRKRPTVVSEPTRE